MRTTILLLFLCAGCGLSQILSGVLSAGGNAPSQVATPTFSPTSGSSCSGSCSITVNDTDSGLSGYAATYCTNASTDCTPGTSYTGAVAFSATGTHLCAFANATGKTQSATHCETYTVTTAPAWISNSTTACYTAGTGTTCAIPTYATGDRIVALLHVFKINAGVPSVPTDNKSGGSNTYSQHAAACSADGGASSYYVCAYSAVAADTSATTVTFAGFGGGSDVSTVIVVLRNTTLFDTGSVALGNGGGSTFSAGPATTASGGAGIAIGFNWLRGSSTATFTAGSGWTVQQAQIAFSSVNATAFLESQATTASTAYTANGTQSISAFDDTLLAIFK